MAHQEGPVKRNKYHISSDNKIWKDKDITINVLVLPLVLDGNESWTMRKAQKKIVQLSVMVLEETATHIADC